MVVYDYQHLIAIDIESNEVDPGLVDLLSVEHGLDALRELSQRAQRS